MRRLSKLCADDPESGAAIRWLAEQRARYGAVCASGEKEDSFLTKYRDPRVKAAILRETLEKCAYCESKYLPVDWGDVEHILPKAGHPERLLDYANLTLACGKCNGGKSDVEYNDGAPLLHPYDDEPDRYFYAAGPMVMPQMKDDPADLGYVRAKRTIIHANINRKGLLERRAEYISDKYQQLVFAFRTAQSPAVRDLARLQIDKIKADDAEYTLVARWFFQSAGVA